MTAADVSLEPSQEVLLTAEDIEEAYKENVKNVTRIKRYLISTFLLAIYILGVTMYLSILASAPPKLLAYIDNHNNFVQKITPNRNPPVTDRQAIHWAKDKASELLSIHFKKYAEQIARRRNYFIGDGWTLYQTSLIENKVIEKIKEKGLIITAINQDTPKLMQKYYLDGKINWRIEMPILQTIQGASDDHVTERMVVSITVQETRRDESIEGLKIRIFGVEE